MIVAELITKLAPLRPEDEVQLRAQCCCDCPRISIELIAVSRNPLTTTYLMETGSL